MLATLQQHDWALSIDQYQAIERDLTGDRIGACDWWTLCQIFSLSCDSFSYGYCEREHLMRVRGAISDGKFLLPMTDKLNQRLATLAEQEKCEREMDEWRWRPGLTFQVGRQESPSNTVEW